MGTNSIFESKILTNEFERIFIIPKLSDKHHIIALPLTENFTLVGTAFDYLLRFHIKKINKKCTDGDWISLMVQGYSKYMGKSGKNVRQIIKKAKKDYRIFLKEGISKEVCKSCLLLAKLDQIQRSGGDLPNDFEIDKKDIHDMINLYNTIPKDEFKSDVCILNPTFGSASLMIGGADADIIIGDTLIDIKTTKEMNFTKQYFRQIVCYYILNKIGGIDGLDKQIDIRKLGIYYSRYGVLFKFNIEDIVDKEELESFIKLFIDVAQGFE